MYKGLLPSFFGVSHGAVQFVAYEEFNKLLREYQQRDDLLFLEGMITGAMSKICATVTTYPYQVVKARLQLRPMQGEPHYSGIVDVISKTWRYVFLICYLFNHDLLTSFLLRGEGLPGFYRGCWLSILRVTPASALTLGMYEFVTKHLE